MIGQEDERERGGQDLATSTLAEIYAQQGLLERARAIYERMAERAPDDPRIAERIESLSRAIREGSARSAPDRDAAGGIAGEAGPVARSSGPDEAAAPDEVFEAWLAKR